jgi:hypothetical protein
MTFLKWYDGGGENGITSKRIFEIEVFFSSQNIDFPFYLMRLLELFFSLFFMLRLDAYSKMELCTPTWLNSDYEGGGVVNILAVDVYSGVEVCTPICLGEASKKNWVANHF